MWKNIKFDVSNALILVVSFLWYILYDVNFKAVKKSCLPLVKVIDFNKFKKI